MSYRVRGSSLFVGMSLVALASLPASAQEEGNNPPDFGDDASYFARDGECDDRRFEGPGMTTTSLLEEDIGHDATDCRIAFQQGRLIVRRGEFVEPTDEEAAAEHIQWGNDRSRYAEDGECNDMRFQGSGMTDRPLRVEDVQHDGTDCRRAFLRSRLTLRE